MSKGKQARMISKLGMQMAESAGGNMDVDDRFAGFIPSGSAMGEIELTRIMEDPDQPRKSFDEEALKGLAENIRAHGVQQPIQLRWSEPHNKWLIVYGHRRYRASQLAGLKIIPCSFIDDGVDESTIRVRQLVENCQREDLAPIEMARGIETLAELTGWSNRKMGEELGLNHTTIGRYRSLLKLPGEVQKLVQDGELAPSVAAEIQKIKEPAMQTQLGREVSSAKLNRSQAIERVTAAQAGKPEKPWIDSRAGKQKPTELLSQTINVAVYRNPNASDWRIKQELLAIIDQIDTEKVET
ncbi:MAG: ParB/RepB/Spo0J family partition protein [Pirellulaceae bacterium]